ncbi:MAG: ubiquinol-cytochrome C chaperone family protein [Minwuia sp.]|uniref:ubiquinol-cytochrome C chaperone family protein n=1 Tax=Minwuia sp. TaxID=2493630 RepID=UPI003A8AFE8E
MALFGLFGADPLKEAAYAMYRTAGSQAREPLFFEKMAVQDDFDGRFDMLVLHVHLLIRRLRALPEKAKAAQQHLFDVFIQDLDQGLRLSGVGDIGIGHRVKKMTHAYYGRAVAYDEALDAGDAEVLRQALHRNLYRGRDVPEAVQAAVTDYVMALERSLKELPDAALLDGRIEFGAPEPEGTS